MGDGYGLQSRSLFQNIFLFQSKVNFKQQISPEKCLKTKKEITDRNSNGQ